MSSSKSKNVKITTHKSFNDLFVKHPELKETLVHSIKGNDYFISNNDSPTFNLKNRKSDSNKNSSEDIKVNMKRKFH